VLALFVTGIPASYRTARVLRPETVAGLEHLGVPTGSILRYRLWDIDRLINRALVYGAVTAVLGAGYGAMVVVLQAVLSRFSGGSTLAVAVTTLTVAVLFQPARRRVQNLVDQRFNRRRYDAVRIIEAFSARLRSEVDLGVISG
jgi:hypothetical protein